MAVVTRFVPLLFALFAAACVPVEDANKTFAAIDKVWDADNDLIFKAQGKRGYKIGKADAMAAMVAALEGLNFKVAQRNEATGELTAFAHAPAPLDRREWQDANEQELPRTREIVREEFGSLVSAAFVLDPNVYWVIFYSQAMGDEKAVGIGTDVRLQLDQKSVYVGSTYPPPAALRIALPRFWTAFEDQLRARNLPLDRLPVH
jgi:hypothetical protein